MFRAILYLIISIFLITLRPHGHRSDRANDGGHDAARKLRHRRPLPDGLPPAPVGGELKRDPVCGTFVPVSTTYRKTRQRRAVSFLLRGVSRQVCRMTSFGTTLSALCSLFG